MLGKDCQVPGEQARLTVWWVPASSPIVCTALRFIGPVPRLSQHYPLSSRVFRFAAAAGTRVSGVSSVAWPTEEDEEAAAEAEAASPVMDMSSVAGGSLARGGLTLGVAEEQEGEDEDASDAQFAVARDPKEKRGRKRIFEEEEEEDGNGAEAAEASPTDQPGAMDEDDDAEAAVSPAAVAPMRSATGQRRCIRCAAAIARLCHAGYDLCTTMRNCQQKKAVPAAALWASLNLLIHTRMTCIFDHTAMLKLCLLAEMRIIINVRASRSQKIVSSFISTGVGKSFPATSQHHQPRTLKHRNSSHA